MNAVSSPSPDAVPHRYPSVSSRPDLPAIEAGVLARWEAEGTFAESIRQRAAAGADEYVFYDGPPFANGLPHHGHLLTGFVKDVIPRYQTMLGKRVDRRFGWDCHGLPAEMAAEQELPVAGRASIIEYGIARFNDYCRTSVLRYTKEWERTVTRQARWVDFEHDYKTMDLPYMESVLWAFKRLYDAGLIYESLRVLPYSWGAQTPLSNFEIRLDDATRPRQDPALTVAFDLDPAPGDPLPLRMLAWTTTPWTLPSNLGLAVGPQVEYSIIEHDGVGVVLASAARPAYERQLGDGRVVGTVLGEDLAGRTYRPLFPYFAHLGAEGSFRVLTAGFVDVSEGTGVVHLAPGFGEADQQLGEANGLGMVVPVDDEGRFTDEVEDWAGENVFDANPAIARRLRDEGRLFRHDTYTHNYPHCWRTDTPIIYRAMPSWYVRVTELRERLLANNEQINWVPSHVRDGRFGMWLEGARDWSISRNRFWGSPIPVWRSDDPAYPRVDVYGSLDELEADFGVRPADLHRPYIDDLVRPNPDDPTKGSLMRRVPEVLDCWFESGSMPFAQVHYPFENKEWFESHFPADFIVEYVNQTRGWFYTLHVLAGALFDRPAFANVICHGVLLDAKGQKLSKKLRNYTEPEELFSTKGADAMRWYLMAAPIVRGGDLRLEDAGIDEVIRQVITPIWNAYAFFTLYANVDKVTAEERADSTRLLDRYILAKTRTLVEGVSAHLDGYDLPGAAAEIQTFIDALNNWYIRRSRDRFWAPAARPSGPDGMAPDGQADDKSAAYDTLYTVLTTLCRVAAPLLPMVVEEIYGGLTGKASVHLADWPDASDLPDDPALVAAMDRLRDVASTALRLREDAGLRVRLPLRSLTVAGPGAEALRPYVDLLADEVNVKQVDLTEDIAGRAQFLLRPNGKVLGPRLGGAMQAVFAAAKAGEWERGPDGVVTVAGHRLEAGEFEVALESAPGMAAAALRSNDAIISIDTELDDELRAEGVARDVVRLVQQARKDADLVVTDRLRLWVDAPTSLSAALTVHRDWIGEQVLASEVHLGPVPEHRAAQDGVVEGEPVRLGLEVLTLS